MNWLILRGLVREQRHWGPFPNTLEDTLKKVDPHAKVFCIDFPGFGTEAARASPKSISQIVDDTRNRWQQLGKPGETWNLFAISLGGMVAMNWTSRYPEDFARLILVNSSVRGISPLFKRMKPHNYPKILSLFWNTEISSREKIVLQLTTNLTFDKLEERARQHVGFAQKIRKWDAISQILAAVRFNAPEHIPVPTLVLVSLQDKLVDPSCSEAIAAKYGADIRKHPTANHDLPLDAPDWVAEQVRDWAYSKK